MSIGEPGGHEPLFNPGELEAAGSKEGQEVGATGEERPRNAVAEAEAANLRAAGFQAESPAAVDAAWEADKAEQEAQRTARNAKTKGTIVGLTEEVKKMAA